MAAKTDIESDSNVEEHTIEAADGLVRSTMVDQASDLEHGWREGYQNIVDSGATEGRLEYTHEYTLITDNGEGVELTEDRGVDLLTNMGETSKDSDDHSTVGEFGIGKGQINAKGQALWVSGNQALLFDIKNFGLTVKQTELANVSSVVDEFDSEWADLIEEHFGDTNRYDGLAVLVKHYEEEVPDKDSYKWDKYEERLKDRFQYLETVRDTKLYIGDERISDNDIEEAVDGNKKDHLEVFSGNNIGDVHIAVKHNSADSLKVYSGGIYVKDESNRGIAGAIVTEKNLSLNFARNEIKSGCPIWNIIDHRLDEIRAKVFSKIKDDRLNKSAREFISSEIFDSGKVDEFGDMEIFKTTDEDMVSLNEIVEQDEIGIAKATNPAADALTEAYGEIVLAESDVATEKLVEARDEDDSFSDEGDLPEIPSDYDAADRAVDTGLHIDHKDVPEHELTPSQMNRLGVARLMINLSDSNFNVEYGESDAAAAWTDGRNFIKITDSASEGGKWEEWVPSLWLTMMHEVAHKWGDKESASHGRLFNRRFRSQIEDNENVLVNVMRTIAEDGLKEAAQQGHNA